MTREKAKQLIKPLRLLSFIVALAMIFTWIPMGLVSPQINKASAGNASFFNINETRFTNPAQTTAFNNTTAMEINNPLFEIADGSYLRTHPDGWTFTGPGAAQSANIVAGAYDTHRFDEFVDSHFDGPTNKPDHIAIMQSNSANSSVLVLANTGTGSVTANFSQRLPVFHADGFFRVTVDFYAVSTQNKSAVYLTPSQNFFDERRPTPHVIVEQMRNSYMAENESRWQTATFLVKTNTREDITFDLSLHLGRQGAAGSGVVYYDNVTVSTFTEQFFRETVWRNAVLDKEYALAGGEDIVRLENARNTTLVDLTRPFDAQPDQVPVLFGDNNVLPAENFNIPNNGNATSSFRSIGNVSDRVQVHPNIAVGQIHNVINFEGENVQVLGNNSYLPYGYQDGVMMVSTINARAGVVFRNPDYSVPVHGTDGNEFTSDLSLRVENHAIYMISFYSLSTADTFIRIYDTRFGTQQPNFVNPWHSGFVHLLSNPTLTTDSRNGWVLNTVFLTGESFNDRNHVDVNIEFWVGGTQNTTGYLLIDDFQIVQVSTTYMERHVHHENSMSFVMDVLQPTTDITNAHFNIGRNRNTVSEVNGNNVMVRYPLIANGWEVELEGETVTDHENQYRIINGIVNTASDHWAHHGTLPVEGIRSGTAYGNASNPGRINNSVTTRNEFNNVYMMQNMELTHQRVMSDPFPLGSGSSNVISFDAATDQLTNNQVWAVIELNGREVSRHRLHNGIGLAAPSGWRNYSIVINTSNFSAPLATISFVLGSEQNPTKGILFIDNVLLNQRQITEDDPADHTVDLSDPSRLYRETGGPNTDIAHSLFFENIGRDEARIEFHRPSDTLYIVADNQSARIRSTLNETINVGVRYLYTVYVRANAFSVGLGTNNDNYIHNPDGDPFPWGLSISLVNGREAAGDERIDTYGGFINMRQEDIEVLRRQTMNLDTVNGPVPVVRLQFVIHPGQSIDLALLIEFGSYYQPVTGQIGIVGTRLEEISETQFNSLVLSSHTREITTYIRPPADEGEPGEAAETNFDWLILPSLIMAVAVIIAVVGTAMRRIKFKRHIAKSHTSYERDDSRSIKTAPIAKEAKPSKPKKKSTGTPTKTPRKLNTEN